MSQIAPISSSSKPTPPQPASVQPPAAQAPSAPAPAATVHISSAAKATVTADKDHDGDSK